MKNIESARTWLRNGANPIFYEISMGRSAVDAKPINPEQLRCKKHKYTINSGPRHKKKAR